MNQKEESKNCIREHQKRRNNSVPWVSFEDDMILEKRIPDHILSPCLGMDVSSIQKRRWFLMKKYMGRSE